MILRKRKAPNAYVETSKQQEHEGDNDVQPKPRTGLLAAAAGSAAVDIDTGTAAGTSEPLAAPTPPAVPGAAKRRPKKPPQDIGIPSLLLGQGMPPAQAAAIVDSLPLGRAGFTPDTLKAACEYLAKADPKLVPLIEEHGPPDRLLAKQGSNFATLAKAIVFQQLATQAASVIYGRVLAACSCREALTPEAVLAAPLPALRQAGLSERKASYIVDLAAHFSDSRLSDDKIAEMDEAELEKALCAVRGIGIWTCHMHAMFHLGSPDVLPTGDLGVRRGMKHLYGLKELPDAAAMARLAERWQPYRSVGSYYMWKVPDIPRSVSAKKKRS